MKGEGQKLNKRNGIIVGLDKLVEDMVESWGFPGVWVVKNPSAKQETWVQSLGQEDALDKEMATQSSILAWEIPKTEEPGGLQSTELQRAGHDLVSKQQQGLRVVFHILLKSHPLGKYLGVLYMLQNERELNVSTQLFFNERNKSVWIFQFLSYSDNKIAMLL